MVTLISGNIAFFVNHANHGVFGCHQLKTKRYQITLLKLYDIIYYDPCIAWSAVTVILQGHSSFLDPITSTLFDPITSNFPYPIPLALVDLGGVLRRSTAW